MNDTISLFNAAPDTAVTNHTAVVELFDPPMCCPTGLAVANFVIPEEQADTPFTQSRRAMQAHYLAEIQQRFDTPVLTIPLLPQEVQGLNMLAELGQQMYSEAVIV